VHIIKSNYLKKTSRNKNKANKKTNKNKTYSLIGYVLNEDSFHTPQCINRNKNKTKIIHIKNKKYTKIKGIY